MGTAREMLENAKRKKAAYELSDEIHSILEEAEKAKIIIDDMRAEYFNRYDVKKVSESEYIRWTYNRYGIYCGIALDYIYNTHKMIKEICTLADEAENEIIKQMEKEKATAKKEIGSTPQQEQPPKMN